MSVRAKIVAALMATGLVTALAVMATVVYAFQRFEHESSYQRAAVFLTRVLSQHDNLFEQHERQPEEFTAFLKSLVLFEPDTQLYLLDPLGTVLASTGSMPLHPGVKVNMGPVLQAVAQGTQPGAMGAYVMGDDPERMDTHTIVAAQPVRRAVIRSDTAPVGYLYLVCHKDSLPANRWQALGSSFAGLALCLIAGIVGLTTLLAALLVSSVTRPLHRLTRAVAHLSEQTQHSAQPPGLDALPPPTRDEFGQLTRAFGSLLATLGHQWEALRRLDHFRREAVSNLSHDLRSPLTATAGCLETLETRWAADPARADDRQLAQVALRNTRNAARLVQSLGDLAMLDEPSFQLRPEVVDLQELLADIALRFAERAAQQHTVLIAPQDEAPVPAAVDIELFERAIANLLDNALKHCGPHQRVTLSAHREATALVVRVADTGPGIAQADVPQLFDRFYQARRSVAPATGEGGKGLGLAIVKRIAELHGGDVSVTSTLGLGTTVHIQLPLQHPTAPTAPTPEHSEID